MRKGSHLSEESKRKMSESRKGNQNLLGHIHSTETRKRMSESHKGKDNHQKGKHASEETRKRQSDAHRGKKRPPFSCPNRRGVPRPEETKQKISDTLMGKLVGNKNPNWHGGGSFDPYCPKFNEVFKERIRERHSRTCYLCPITEHENGIKLSIHHIDYAKNSICNGNDWAFVPLCKHHHSNSNFNRWYWFNLLINYWAANPEINLEAPCQMMIYP